MVYVIFICKLLVIVSFMVLFKREELGSVVLFGVLEEGGWRDLVDDIND